MLGMGGGAQRAEELSPAFQELSFGLKALLEKMLQSPDAATVLPSQGALGKVLVTFKLGSHTFSLLAASNPAYESLSRQQRDVAVLAARGLSNKEIARVKGIEPGTVAVHLERIFRKLGVDSRIALASSLTLLREPLPASKNEDAV